MKGRPQVGLAARIVDDAIRVEAESPLPLNEWSHVAWTYDGSRAAAGVRIYVDGRPATVRGVTDTLSTKLKTTAVRKGDVYVLNGSKIWISLADVADHFLVVASTDKSKRHHGLTAFIVERGFAGFSSATIQSERICRGM